MRIRIKMQDFELEVEASTESVARAVVADFAKGFKDSAGQMSAVTKATIGALEQVGHTAESR